VSIFIIGYLLPKLCKIRVKEKFFLYRIFNMDRLRIWFDILTPKQVLFFKPIVDILLSSGKSVLCTSRKYRECTELAREKLLQIEIIGKYGGPLKYDKLRQSAKRTYELADTVKEFEPDVAISFSSPEAARVAFGLGIKQIVFNDSPHAYAVGKLTIPLAQFLLCPWIIPYHAWENFGIRRKQIIRYRALDPAVWLKRQQLKDVPASEKLRAKYRLTKENTVVIRPEETKAAYMIYKKNKTTISLIQPLIENLHKTTNILILCRYEEQVEEISRRFGSKITVLDKIVDGLELISIADIFIGAGGTMTAEAALLGKPTISISPIQFYVEDYLIRTGLVKKVSGPDRLVDLVKKMINDEPSLIRQKKLASIILNKMEDPMAKLNKLLDSYITL
ncbi:MAG: DUF354 domain-containing protein, partial [Nitrososphaeraceae archaeon]